MKRFPPTLSFKSARTAVACAGSLFFAAGASAELIVGLTANNSLVRFDSATPGTISGAVAISGLTFGDVVYGIDRRPSLGPNNGALYGFASNGLGAGRIYTLDPTSGAATLAATLAADPADTTAPTPFTSVSGRQFGVDFNPTVDRLRVTSDTGENLRINVDNGLTQLDGPLAYPAGDPNFGDVPFVDAVAYSNNFAGAVTTVLRGVDAAQSADLLVVHTVPNSGTLMSSLSLPFDSFAGSSRGYDISGLSGTPYFSVGGTGGTQLYTATGLIGTVGGGVNLIGIAAPVGVAPIPEPETYALMMAGLGAVGFFARRRKQKQA